MTDEIKDSYSALELKPDASPEAVKEAYRELVKVWHPDRFSGDKKLERRALEKLKCINLAYERIKDRKPIKISSAGAQGDFPPPEPPRRNARASPGIAPGIKTCVVPNSRDVKLGCFLVAGVACLIGALIIAAIFYDESTAGRRYVTGAGLTNAQPRSAARVGDSNSVGSASGRKPSSKEADDTVAENPVLTIEAVERKLAELEEKAKARAIGFTSRPPDDSHSPSEEASGRRIPPRTGKRLDFVTEGFYSTGVAHLHSGRGKREFVRAADYFLQASNRGHPDAQYQLAVMLRDGIGVEADPERALYWITIAAELKQKEALSSRTSFEIGINTRRAAELQAEAMKRIEAFRK